MENGEGGGTGGKRFVSMTTAWVGGVRKVAVAPFYQFPHGAGRDLLPAYPYYL